jgi:NADP-dependent 3-hydroxy acid dehydrogenase YdfG
MLPLEGKFAVTTGGTSGIGARTAEVFVAHSIRGQLLHRKSTLVTLDIFTSAPNV